MNAAIDDRTQRQLDAQAQQMAFELGYASSPTAPAPQQELPTMGRPASQKQFDFIKKLIGERELSPELAEQVREAREKAVQHRLTSKAASTLIDALLAAPKASVQAIPNSFQQATEDITAGMYWIHGDHLVRVYRGQQSGHLLVKRVHIEQDGDDTTVSYEYLGAASRVMTKAATPQRIPLEQVGQLGVVTNICMVCGRRLDDPESVDRGIGPVCAQNY